jgi:hypothetical protein
MSMYRKEWDCCGDVSETNGWEPEACPFCPAPPSPSTTPEVDERAAFEANLPKSWSREKLTDDDGGVRYVSTLTLGAWMGWGLGRHELASRPAEVDDEGLPALPRPAYYDRVTARMSGDGIGFTAEQYRQGQRDAVAAYKRQQVALQALADQAQELDMGYGAAPSHTTNKEK